MTTILGISAFSPDSAAALVCDGEVVAAAAEERFSRIEHDGAFPRHAAACCLREAGLTPADVDFIAYYEKPLTRMGRALQSCLALAPRGLGSFAEWLPTWLGQTLGMRRKLRAGTGASRAPVVFLDRQESHAASAFFPSPYDEAAILTLDGAGVGTTSACGSGSGSRLELTHHLRFPHSLGLLYSAIADYCGFGFHSCEGLMGLAPHGRPVYRDLITKHLLHLKSDGSFCLNARYFDCCPGRMKTNRRFVRLFGSPFRHPQALLLQRHMDLAASIQAVTEEALLRLAHDLHRRTGMSRLVLAGSGALNAAANGRLLREGPFDAIWIQPASGNAAAALGAALFVWHQWLGKPRKPAGHDSHKGGLLGPACDVSEVLGALDGAGLPHRHFEDEVELLEHISAALAEGKVVGWCGGRMEFGPHGLGARSILADPRSSRMATIINRKLGGCDSFQPCSAAVLAEYAHEWFSIQPGEESPFMLLTLPVRQERRRPLSDEERVAMIGDPDLRRRIDVARSEIPAVTHVDYNAQVQTVDAETNPRLYRLLQGFHRRTDCPVLAKTTFKVRGEPIVCTPAEALRSFLETDLDLLVLQDTVVSRETIAGRHQGVRPRAEVVVPSSAGERRGRQA
jgi:carbamoyltransferase